MDENPSIIVFTYVYPPDIEIGGWRPFRFKKFWERKGHTVPVVCAAPDPPAFIADGNVHRIPGIVPGVTRKSALAYLDLALRLGIFYDSGFVWVPRATRYASRWMKAAEKPVVFSTSPPIHTHLAALRLKKQYGVKWIADFRDPLVGGTGRKRAWTRHFDPYFERMFVRNADLIIANTDAARELWQKRNPEHADKIRVLWNGFDPDDFIGIAPPPKRDFKLLSHVGDIYGPRDPLFLFRAAGRLIERDRLKPSDFRLEFHGMVDESSMTHSAARRLIELGCLHHEPESPSKEKSEKLMRAADVLVLVDFVDPSPLHVPSKVFFYVRTGRPVLASTPAGSPAERILSRSGIPHVCLHPGDSDERVEHGLMEIMTHSGGPHTASDWFLQTFDSSRQADTLLNWIGALSESQLVCR